MRVADLETQNSAANPLDMLEEIISTNDWEFERRSESEMAVEIPGQWSSYNLYFAWSEDLQAIHLSCAFDMRAPESKRHDLYELLALLNERMWLGHFTLWSEEGLPMFRHSMFVKGGDLPENAYQDLVEIAVSECERFYPAFQFVVWGGKSAKDAVEASMLDTVGEA